MTNIPEHNASDRSATSECLSRRRVLRGIASAAASGPLLAACAPLWPVCSFNYKLRIVVSVDGAPKEGSSVIQVSLYDHGTTWRNPDMDRFRARTWGEAVAIELGSFGPLFGLLQHPPTTAGFNGRQPHHVLLQIIAARRKLNPTYDDVPLIPELEGEFTLKEEHTPVLVRFANINDPTTAELVRPDDLGRVFGPGVRFDRATISVTSEQRTEDALRRHLPWLDSVEGNLLGGLTNSATGPLAGQIGRGNFELRGYRAEHSAHFSSSDRGGSPTWASAWLSGRPRLLPYQSAIGDSKSPAIAHCVIHATTNSGRAHASAPSPMQACPSPSSSHGPCETEM